MELLLNGQTRIDQNSPDDTVQNLIEQVKADGLAPGQMVVGVEVDGRLLDEREFEQVFPKPLDTFDKVNVVISEKKTVINDALLSAHDTLEQLKNIQSEAVELLTQGSIPEAMEQLSQCFNRWNQVNDVIIKSCLLAGIEPGKLELDGRSVEQIMTDFANQLSDVREALTARDFVWLADIFNYELEHAPTTMQEMVDDIRQTLCTHLEG